MKRLKAGGSGDVLIMGSGQLVHALTDAGLIDEYHVFVHPVVVGSGKRLFRDGSPLIGLRLTEAKMSAAVLCAHLRARARRRRRHGRRDGRSRGDRVKQTN